MILINPPARTIPSLPNDKMARQPERELKKLQELSTNMIIIIMASRQCRIRQLAFLTQFLEHGILTPLHRFPPSSAAAN